MGFRKVNGVTSFLRLATCKANFRTINNQALCERCGKGVAYRPVLAIIGHGKHNGEWFTPTRPLTERFAWNMEAASGIISCLLGDGDSHQRSEHDKDEGGYQFQVVNTAFWGEPHSGNSRKGRKGGMRKKKAIHDFYEMKARGEKITFLTAYDYPTATFADEAGLDMLLVGDSLGMCVYGYAGTIPVTMDQMICHAEAVHRGAPNCFVIGDMPFMSYQSSIEKAVENAGRFLKEAGCDAVKLEGGIRIVPQIKAIVDAGIVVMGHIGLTPQSSGQLGGHKAQGRTAETAKLLVEDAMAVEEAGAHMILLEAIPPEAGAYITKKLSIPVLSIGAGPYCDGQLLIVSDMIGQFQAFTPKFVKKYGNVAEAVVNAMREYCNDVRAGKFPLDEHCYKMITGEEKKFLELMGEPN